LRKLGNPMRGRLPGHRYSRAAYAFRNFLAENLRRSPMKDPFVLKHIKTNASHLSGVKGLDHRTGVDKPAAGRVDEENPEPTQRKRFTLNHMSRHRIERHVQGNHMRLAHQLLEGDVM